jgi:aminoglycoside phosphotransferase
MSNKKSLSQFIAEATLVHGDKCGYSKFIYNGTNTKGIIDCNICGDEFLQTPKKHLNGQRCPNCVNLKRLTIEDFIRKSNGGVNS